MLFLYLLLFLLYIYLNILSVVRVTLVTSEFGDWACTLMSVPIAFYGELPALGNYQMGES